MAIILHAYNFYRIDDLTFLFTTDAGDDYQRYLISYAKYFASHPHVAPNFFSFNLKLVSNGGKQVRKSTDKKIADTVVTIVGDFLDSQTNTVVYVCDNSDGKQAARSTKFLSWFDYYNHPSSKIVQVTSILPLADYSSIVHYLFTRKINVLPTWYLLILN